MSQHPEKSGFSTLGHWLGIQAKPALGRLGPAALGGLFGLLATGMVMRFWLGGDGSLPLLVAPMGASAVLLFAVPSSPLAQPWAIIGGNTISALCGIFWMKLLGDPTYAAPLAVASAIAMMSLTRCLHPPGGACALTGVIGGKAVVAAGWSFAAVPVGVNSMLLVAFGLLFNAAMRGNYPHRAAQFVAAQPPKAGYTMADIEQVLSQYDALLDVSSEDLDTLFRQVETRAYRRLHGIIRCEQIMRGDCPTLAPEDRLDHARALFITHGLDAVPVVDGEGRVEGLLQASALLHADQTEVRAVMDTSPCLAPPTSPIDELLPILSGGMHRQAMIVDGDHRLLGLISQTDLLAALWRGHVAENIALSAEQT